MQAAAETIQSAASAAYAQSRADLEAKAERLSSELSELLRYQESERQRLQEESAVGGGLGPLGQSTMRTEVFAELQRGVDAAKGGASRVAQLRVLASEMTQALERLRADAPQAAFVTITAGDPVESVMDALREHEARQAPAVALVGKMRAAQLHLAALYRQGTHDSYFERFSLTSLDEDERHFLAPFVVLALDVPVTEELLPLERFALAQCPVVVVRVHTLREGDAEQGLPLPYAALAFAPRWIWLQTTWDLQKQEQPPFAAEAIADLGHIAAPVFLDVLASASPRQLQLAAQCGVWPVLAYYPGGSRRERRGELLVRSGAASDRAGLDPAYFAWQLSDGADARGHFVELGEAHDRSQGKPIADYLALPSAERHYYFPYIVADEQRRLVPPDVLRYAEQLSCLNVIWDRLSPASVEPAAPQRAPAPPQSSATREPEAAPPASNAPAEQEAVRAAVYRMLTGLLELGTPKGGSQ